MKRLYYTGILLIFLPFIISFLSTSAHGTSIKDLPGFRVTQVHDGDTVSIRAKSFAGIPLKTEKVRLIGIDAPELKQDPWGRRSKKHLKKLLSESDWFIYLEYDVEQRDKYGRLLGYLWGKDGQLINEKMVGSGQAVLYTIPPNVKHIQRLEEAQKKAQARKAGFWKEGGLSELPSQWRKDNPRK